MQEQARQDQRWRGMVHQFSLLQDEVRQERWELGRGRGRARPMEEQHGLSLSAPVSTAVSPSHAMSREAQADLQWWASGGQGPAGAVTMPAAAAVIPSSSGVQAAVPGAAIGVQGSSAAAMSAVRLTAGPGTSRSVCRRRCGGGTRLGINNPSSDSGGPSSSSTGSRPRVGTIYRLERA